MSNNEANSLAGSKVNPKAARRATNQAEKAMRRTPVVMIHGLLGSIDYFDPQQYLDHIAVHTPDLMGYGASAEATSTGSAQALTLDRQARHIADYLRHRVKSGAWLLGHSVGGAVAMLAAAQAPEHVLGVISVEGNFTLDDAFWCRQIAPLDPAEWDARYQAMCSDEHAWLRAAGIAPTPDRATWARRILDNQSATVIQAMARAVIAETGDPDFLVRMRKLVDSGLPIALLSGESSRPDWNVPPWVVAMATHDIVVPEAGHMSMLESPQAFCRAVRAVVEGGVS